MQVAETGGEVDEGPTRFARYKYPAMRKTLGNFTLHVRPRIQPAPAGTCIIASTDVRAPLTFAAFVVRGLMLCWSQVDEGEFTDSEILVMLGENGTGKTTFIRMLAGMLKPDDHFCELPEYNVSYKPQKISPKFTSTVRNLLHKRIRDAYLHPTFINDVMKPMQVRVLKGAPGSLLPEHVRDCAIRAQAAHVCS
jgi:ATP-binding cassette subfamily E protein 1